MATTQAILNDVDLRYRNTFTVNQKLVWMNEEQRELFDVLEIDSAPYAFQTVGGENFYPLPEQFDVTKIKVVTYQIDEGDTPNYIEIPFKRNDDNEFGNHVVWYTIVSDAFYLYVADEVPGERLVYIYCDADPAEITAENTLSNPELPVKYQEILKLGVLKRIAGARKDIVMRNNYDMEYQQKIDDVLWSRKMKEPEWNAPVDVMPRIQHGWRRTAFAYTVTEEV